MLYEEGQQPTGEGFSEEYEVKYYFKYLDPDGKIHQSQHKYKEYRGREKNMHEVVKSEFLKLHPYAHIVSIAYI